MCVCNMKAIQLTVSEISSGNETQTHGRTDARLHGPAPTSWEGDKKGNLDFFKQYLFFEFEEKCHCKMLIFSYMG